MVGNKVGNPFHFQAAPFLACVLLKGFVSEVRRRSRSCEEKKRSSPRLGRAEVVGLPRLWNVR